MKKLFMLLMVLCMMAPIGARAEGRNWWPVQIDESDQYYDFKKIGQWPADVITNETAIYTILFRPRVAAVQPLNNSVKVLIDATTAARSIVVQYSVDGKTWTTRNYRNIGYKGPVTCIRKWQIKLHAKENYHSSWCARQFKQGGATLDYKKTASLRSQMAQLYFDDHLIDGIRKKVAFPVLLNIPARAKLVRIRYAYTGLKKNLYSEWLTVKVR